jgi:receptor protein-tyrosine kinase
VVRNLALAFRETGRRVVVVDLDLRHPALARLYGVPIGRGMTDVLRGEAGIDDVAIQVAVNLPTFDDLLVTESLDVTSSNGTNGVNGHATVPGGVDHITLLLGGARPANPPAVLASTRLVEVLDELRERYDLMLIDSAPVLAVTDTVPLLRYADAALFVGRLGVTTRDTVKHLMEFLGRVPDLNLLGIVANDLSRLDAASYGYGYGYGPYAQEPKSDRRSRKAEAERPAQIV